MINARNMSARSGMARWIARHRVVISLLIHAVLIALALLLSFALAYNFTGALPKGPRDLYGTHWGWLVDFYPPLLMMALPIKLTLLATTRQLKGSWRYVGLHDLVNVTFASLLSSSLLIVVYFVIENVWQQVAHRPLIDYAVPRLRQSVFLLDFGLTIALICGARILVRFYYEELAQGPAERSQQRRVLVVGSADAAESLLREVRRMPAGPYRVIGLIDDRPDQSPSSIHGVEVVGRSADIRELVERHRVDEVWLALPDPTPRHMRDLVERCGGTGVRFRTMPGLSDLIHGRVQVSRLRDVQIEDLLGREPVQLDMDRLGAELRDHHILVTGAGGSIGAELCRQICRFAPRRLILVERAENALFHIDRQLRATWPEVNVVPVVADVTDAPRITRIIESLCPQIVFHAAAHKHVPMMEMNTGEAIKNNIGGTCVLAQACLRSGVGKMVLISTDKAVNPSSVMGCTKRIAELVVQGLGTRGGTQFVTVRFGNVLGSEGSVVPLFREQIARGEPLTVTHPEMRRYFMTIPEAAQLVLQAAAQGRGGEIFMLDMGEPVRIVDLARNMIRLSGLRPDIDLEIRFIGERPGEKLFEELAIDGEYVLPTAHPRIGVLRHIDVDWAQIEPLIRELIERADSTDDAQLRQAMARLVPEYTPPTANLGPGVF